MEQSDALDALRTFRDSLYECLERRADALFELTDSILTAGVVPSPVHLSLEAVHRRGWGSLYAALSRGRIDAASLRALLSRYPLAGGQPPVYAVDVSVRSRCDAEASPLLKATTTIPRATRPANPSSPALGLPVDRPAGIRSRKLGCSGGGTPRAAYREPQRARRRADQARQSSTRAVWCIATLLCSTLDTILCNCIPGWRAATLRFW
jgi:hypothetical protein